MKMDLHKMKCRDLREEAKRRGLRRYSKLKKNQLIQYVSTGVHPHMHADNPTIQIEEQYTIPEVEKHTPGAPLSEKNGLPINKILEGDCLSILPSFPMGVFDCCIADPPFNMSQKKGLSWAFSSHITMQEGWDIFSKDEYSQFTLDWISEVLRVVKPNGNVFVFGSFHSIFTVGFILQNILNRRIITQIVWYKPNAQPNITCRMFTESTEFIIWAVNNENKKAKNWTFNYQEMKTMNNNKQMRNMWEIPLTKPSERKYGKHPSQKPLEVVERLILAGTNEEDLILDPFGGAGTTGVGAQKHNRKWTMIEQNEQYNQIAKNRLSQLQSKIQ